MMGVFVPLNELEKDLLSAKAETLSVKEFIATLLASDVAVPSTTEMDADGNGLTPLFFDKDGIGMLAAFTDKSRVPTAAPMAPFCLTINAFELLKRLPHAYGIVINPGCSAGFDIPPSGIRQIIEEFSGS